MREETGHYYQQKAQEVLRFIQNNLGTDLSVKALSDYSGISTFHFHRIMKAYLDEPIGSFIDRKRLDSSVALLRYSTMALHEIALKIGYNDVSAFSKAFSKEFGISPQIFKQNTDFTLNTHIDFYFSISQELKTDIKPKYITLPAKKVICITVKGIYGGEKVYQAWDEILDFATKNKLTGWNPEAFSVYYDDPDICDFEDCVSDICIVTKKNCLPHDKIHEKTMDGGKFAVFRYKGPYERLWELYENIYKSWLLLSDFRIRDSPTIEKYLNYSSKTGQENPITEIYIPIE